MYKASISEGVAHTVPRDVRASLLSLVALSDVWESLTPLARNEWLCWVESAKKNETRKRRIRSMKEKLLAGVRRPCCWAGCGHRAQ